MAPTPSKACNIWMEMQDLIGLARNWPYNIRRLMWAREWNEWDRVIIAGFAWVNGLYEPLIYEWAFLRRIFTPGSERHQHMRSIFRGLDDGRYTYLWAWNVTSGRYEYMDGRPRTQSKK